MPVTINVKETGNVLDIKVTPVRLDMTTGQGKQTIKFNCVSTDYSFPANAADAIKIEDPTGQFVGLTKKNVNLIEVDDKCTEPGNYKYTIQVVKNGTNETLSIDPLIRNN